MKRILSLFLFISFILSLSSCVNIVKYEKCAKSRDYTTVESISLYELGSDELHLKYCVPLESPTIDELDKLYSPKEFLSDESIKSFISELNDATFRRRTVRVMNHNIPEENTYSGYLIKITYKNGDVDIVSRYAQIYYSGNEANEYENKCASKSWDAILDHFSSIE